MNTASRKKEIADVRALDRGLPFPTLDALAEGYEVYPVVDAVGGTSKLADKTALKRMSQTGAQLASIARIACELQRDWSRKSAWLRRCYAGCRYFFET